MRGRKLTHRGQFLHAGARGVGIQDADADAALIQALRQAIENPRHLGVAGHVLHPATVPHGTAERLQRGFFVGAGHGTDAREGPVGGGAVVQHPSLGRLTPVPGCDRQHPRFQVQRRCHPVEGLHAVGWDRLAVRMQVYETGGHHQAGGVDGSFGVAQLRPDRGNLAIQHRHVRNGVRPARRDPPPGRH